MMARQRSRLFVMATLFASTALLVSACSDNEPDPNAEIGPDPKLPDQSQYLIPPMHIAKVVGWKDGKVPTVASGLEVKALASGLQHPRSVYTLPNGDILAVESVAPPEVSAKRPKDLIMGIVQSFATGGTGSSGKSNRITLLRDADGDGTAEIQDVFLDHLNSPFGVVLVGNDLYVANTDAVVRYAYTPGETKITEPGTVLTDLPGGPIDHHWTKSMTASADGSLLYVGVGSNSNITETASRRRKTGQRSGKSIGRRECTAFSQAVCAIQMG